MALPKKYRSRRRNLIVRRSKAGLGLYTNTPIERGGFVIQYIGPIIRGKKAIDSEGRYLFETNPRRVIDGSTRKNTARYINHSCRPNCESDVRRGNVLIFAKRNIAAGEELSYDYGEEYFNDYIKPNGCRCNKCM